jgi:hypothetical protein
LGGCWKLHMALMPLLALLVPLAVTHSQENKTPQGVCDGRAGVIGLYNRFLDAAFPHDHASLALKAKRPPKKPELVYSIVLRYLPSFHTESQIMVLHNGDGSIAIFEYTLPRGSHSIWQEVNGLYGKGPCPTEEELATRAKVVERRIAAPSAPLKELISTVLSEKWDLQLEPQMNPQAGASSTLQYMLDGTLYDLWIDGWENSAHFRLHGPRKDADLTTTRIIAWMEQVKKAVEQELPPEE